MRLGGDGHVGRVYGVRVTWRVAGRAPSRGGLMKCSADQGCSGRAKSLTCSQVSRAWEAVRGGSKLHSVELA